LSTERAINPFLRSRSRAVSNAVRQRDARAMDDVTTFAALRTWKNEF
jgi:hydroxyacylglutathione hydrolase